MAKQRPLTAYAPLFVPDRYGADEARLIQPFFTNLSRSVYAPLIFAPELIGALCSRTSRAAGDLRQIFLREYVIPFLNPERTEKDTDETWTAKVRYGQELQAFIDFLQEHPLLDLFANPRARNFYARWLAQYGDDSIAQMAGSHLAYSALSQVAIKHLEDQRIGLAPIEKSTRYVNYGTKVGGRYLYYTPPDLEDLGLTGEYERVMNTLFETYAALIPRLIVWLTGQFPSEKSAVIEKKAFDCLRGLLPMATLSQVAFFGNGQAFEYLVSRCGGHPLGEIRWAGQAALDELDQVTPAFLRRLKDESRQALVADYQRYLALKGDRVDPFAWQHPTADGEPAPVALAAADEMSVLLVEHDRDGELKVITGMLYCAPSNHLGWEETLAKVRQLSQNERQAIVDAYFQGRTARWQKVGRALENSYVRWEIVMNLGAWRDLHRHRMLTQQRQMFSPYHGYDIPPEITQAGLEAEFQAALDPLADLYEKIAKHDRHLAQYATALAHRIRFMQWENLRQSFWQIELRTIPEGHPDYRHVEQKKFQALKVAFPLLAERMFADMAEYDFARRGQEQRFQKKLAQLTESQ